MRLEYFELVDRIAALDRERGTIAAECVLPQASPVFEGHFPGHPILPGVLMIEAMAQAGGWLVMARQGLQRMAFLASVREAKMRRFLEPGQALGVEAVLVHEGSGYAVATGRILAEGCRVADCEIKYRVMDFPTPELRAAMLRRAARVQMPAELLADA